MNASDIMTRDVIGVPHEMSVEELSKLLADRRISGAPVCDVEGRLVGIATEADILSRPGLTVGDIMTRDVVSVSPSTAVDEIAWILTKHNFRRVPVVGDGHLVGIVSRLDIVRHVGTAPQLREQLVRYIIDQRGIPYWSAVEIADYVAFSRQRRRRQAQVDADLLEWAQLRAVS